MSSIFRISKKMPIRSNSREINTGSTADIAFLLLIFFLVATTILNDMGLLVKLPPYQPDQSEPVVIKERNVFTVKINAANQLLVEGQSMELKFLKDEIKNFIVNPLNKSNLAEQSDKAIVSLQNDRVTKYEIYIQVYNEIKSAYNELWEEISISRFGKNMTELSSPQLEAIKKDFPLVISEAEPRSFGQEF
jgi:biopolymer transport protein ExbD